jgi:uncharacterized damage-inducible protein DinB
MVGDLEDPRRSEPSFVLNERDMLEGWLEFHRVTLLLKCEGLNDAQRKARPVATSILSLHGLLRHMAEVERGWFRRSLLSDTDTPYRWPDDLNDDSDIFPLDEANWNDDLAAWYEECDASREAARGKSLDFTGLRGGDPVSLRWIYSHMIEEYARHNGHADIIREMVDGNVGA